MRRDERPRGVEVAVAAPLFSTLTYLPQPGQDIRPGHRLLVPLGRRTVTGYALETGVTPPAGVEARAVTAVEDEEPAFPASMVPFFRFIADYYHFPIGEVIRAALPAGMSRHSTKVIELTGSPDLGDDSPDWLRRLASRGRLPAGYARKVLARTGDRKLVEELKAAGVIAVREKLSKAAGLARRTFVRLIDGVTCEKDLSRPEARVVELLREMDRDGDGVARAELARRYSGTATGLKRLSGRGAVEIFEKTVFRDPLAGGDMHFPPPERLTPDQEQALAAIVPAIRERAFAPFLLHGVTGSGKTEVYLKATATALAEGRGVIVLVPEIALATQIEAHFVSRFGEEVALLHSGLTRSQRLGQWERVRRGAARVVIGARSAVFAPMADPGLIIVDEEHDPAYKQEDGLRYHGRDLAILRAQMAGATALMGSATPSVATFHKAGRDGDKDGKNKKFRLLTLPRRISPHPMPEIRIVDLKKVLTVSGRPPMISPELRQEIEKNLDRGEQSLIFLNRRGYANMVVCRDCGEVVGCRNCRVALTLHQMEAAMVCHHCGFSLPRDLVCTSCRSARLVPLGFGTERIEAELARIFPGARLSRLDRDSAADRERFFSILKQVRDGETDILVGTQMITKGHDFPRVTLVGVICADTGLGLPDYKAGERTFQLLAQVAGRAGRADLPGRVVVQTMQPDHYAIACARNHDYHTLYRRELELRQRLRFPPFGFLVCLRCESESEERTREAALALAERIKTMQERPAELLGPSPAPLAKLQKRYRWHMLARDTSRTRLKEFCAALRGNLPKSCRGRVKVIVDVDPENML